MADEGAENLPTAVTKAYDLLLWLINHVGKFPRSHRFVLGDRIESRMLTVLQLLILTTSACEENDRLGQANANMPHGGKIE